jgi:uncharacterized protein (TIGR03435 family)
MYGPRADRIIIPLLTAILSIAAHAQTSYQPAFEVVSIKPIDFMTRPAGDTGFHIEPGRAYCNCMLSLILENAYGIRPFRIIGPTWLQEPGSGKVPFLYQLDARFPATTNTNQVPEMLRAMLADRFHMQAHLEDRSDPVYALRIAPGGLKLSLAPPPDSSLPIRPTVPFPTVTPGSFSMNMNSLELKINGPFTMSKLAWFLTPSMDRDVVDQTGEDAEFTVQMDARIPEGRKVPAIVSQLRWADDDPRLINIPSIFSEIQKLGLRLEPTRAPIKHLVIDRIESIPTPN